MKFSEKIIIESVNQRDIYYYTERALPGSGEDSERGEKLSVSFKMTDCQTVVNQR
jgi:hypothetical protein